MDSIFTPKKKYMDSMKTIKYEILGKRISRYTKVCDNWSLNFAEMFRDGGETVKGRLGQRLEIFAGKMKR